MPDKVETLRKLLEDGYRIDDVGSERGILEARLTRGEDHVVLKLLPSEAAALLRDPRPLR